MSVLWGHLAYCADIDAGDAWLSEYDDDKTGSNIIITRTNNGEEL
jgi:hypothetical protein